MSKEQEGIYHLAGGMTVTDANLEVDAQRLETDECGGAWKILPGRLQFFGGDTMPVGTHLSKSLVRESDKVVGELGQTHSELVRHFTFDGSLVLKT